MQSDLLELVDPREASKRGVVAPDDPSIQLHSTHGPLREVQVLHDRLLNLFARIDGLEPRDIIVMAPDIDAYAPYVEAVFGAAEAPMRIPWSVADRRAAAEQPVLGALKAERWRIWAFCSPSSRFSVAGASSSRGRGR